MRGLLGILSFFFCNVFNKLNNTGARLLDSFYHMSLKLIKNPIFGVKTSRFCHLLRNLIMDVIGLSIFLHGIISLTPRHDVM